MLYRPNVAWTMRGMECRLFDVSQTCKGDQHLCDARLISAGASPPRENAHVSNSPHVAVRCNRVYRLPEEVSRDTQHMCRLLIKVADTHTHTHLRDKHPYKKRLTKCKRCKQRSRRLKYTAQYLGTYILLRSKMFCDSIAAYCIIFKTIAPCNKHNRRHKKLNE